MPTRTKLRAVIIDDESSARRLMKELLARHPSVELAGEADSGSSGIELISRLNPDIVFLDIELRDRTGFDMLKDLPNQPFIVFVTAYEQFAMKAFDSYSIDYLLKPVDEERFDKTIEKIRRFILNGSQETNKPGKIASVAEKTPHHTTLSIKNGNKISLVQMDEIAFLKANDKYTYIHMIDGQKKFSDHNLSMVESKMSPDFIRVQKSFVINKKKVLEIRRYTNYRFALTMSDKDLTTIVSGPSYWSILKNAFFS